MSIVSRANAAQSPVPAGVPANPADRPPAPRGVGNRPSGLASAANRSENCFASLWNFVRPYLESLWNLLRRLFVDERPAPPAGRLQGVHLAQSPAESTEAARPLQNLVSPLGRFKQQINETFNDDYFRAYFGTLKWPYAMHVNIRIYNGPSNGSDGKPLVSEFNTIHNGGSFTPARILEFLKDFEYQLKRNPQSINLDNSESVRLGILFCAQKHCTHNTYVVRFVNQTFDWDPSGVIPTTEAPDQEMGLSSQGVRDRIARELRIQSGAVV
ncbi:MAG: hypothetical protein ACHQT8_06430 [Chlamydiales bacterium]